MKKFGILGMLLRVFLPTIVLSSLYLLIGWFCRSIPHILLFCLIALFTMIPIELGFILYDSKREDGRCSLKSALVGQEKIPLWQMILYAAVFFGVAGLASVFIQPVELNLLSGVRNYLLSLLPAGFDWNDLAYIKSFPKGTLIATCIFYGIFNVLIGPITEELFFRGYLTSHYGKQNMGTPVLIALLFSLYHLWLPFNNVFRIVIFVPLAVAVYKKKNISISILFHCLCNLFSVLSFCTAILSSGSELS